MQPFRKWIAHGCAAPDEAVLKILGEEEFTLAGGSGGKDYGIPDVDLMITGKLHGLAKDIRIGPDQDRCLEPPRTAAARASRLPAPLRRRTRKSSPST